MTTKNWGRRVIDSRGSHFRIESGSPLIGRDGAETFKIYAVNDNQEVFLITHGHGSGLGRVACDKSIEIRAGDKNNPNSVDIRVSAATGDITINADRGRVRVNAKDIAVHAERDIDLDAGRNINMKATTGRILLKSNTVSSYGKKGNLVPKSWGAKVLANSFVPDDTIAKFFDIATQATSLGAGPLGDGGVAGAAANGLGLSLQDLGINNPDIGGIEAIEKAVEEAALGLKGPLEDLTNFISGEGANAIPESISGALGKVTGGSGFGGLSSLVDKASGIIGDPSSITANASSLLGNNSALSSIGSIGKIAGGDIGSLTSAAKSSFGVISGGHSLTGVKDQIASGLLGKGAAATVGAKTSDQLAVMDSLVPKGFKIDQVAAIKKNLSEKLNSETLSAVSLAAEEAQKDIQRALGEGALDDLASNAAKTLLEGGMISGLVNKTFNT